MITGETILCYAADPWRGLWRNRHQIMTRLARHNTVLYVEPRRYLWQTLRQIRSGELRAADLRAPLLARHESDLWIYHDPYYAPFAGHLSGGPLTAALRRRALRRALCDLGAGRPILWLLRPFQADQIGLYDEKLVVYHVTDEYSAYPTVADPAAFLRQEEALLRRADLVIVTSPGLLASKGRHNPNTHLVPNAVDFAGFQQALATGQPLPALGEGADAIPRPRIGYAGALNEKLDFVLLARVAEAHPGWQFVMIGQVDLVREPTRADALRRLPNVHWRGPIPISELPGAIAAMDVCLLPYERNQWTANIDSLKLYEYLACGRPVVGADIPATRAFAGLVRIADEPDAFAAAIAAALAEDSPELVAQRQAVAAANTWDMRVEQISGLLVESPGQLKADP